MENIHHNNSILSAHVCMQKWCVISSKRDALTALADMGDIEQCKLIKGNNKRELDGYKIPQNDRVDRDK